MNKTRRLNAENKELFPYDPRYWKQVSAKHRKSKCFRILNDGILVLLLVSTTVRKKYPVNIVLLMLYTVLTSMMVALPFTSLEIKWQLIAWAVTLLSFVVFTLLGASIRIRLLYTNLWFIVIYTAAFIVIIVAVFVSRYLQIRAIFTPLMVVLLFTSLATYGMGFCIGIACHIYINRSTYWKTFIMVSCIGKYGAYCNHSCCVHLKQLWANGMF
ncbi:unnamed protein product [Schistosoma guineensis]|nr:unnamed protein product [Schistosoma guineensis]